MKIQSDALYGSHYCRLQPGYQAKTLNGGKVKHDATLFNVGAVYHLTDAQQVFANFSHKDQIYPMFNVCFVMCRQVLL